MLTFSTSCHILRTWVNEGLRGCWTPVLKITLQEVGYFNRSAGYGGHEGDGFDCSRLASLRRERRGVTQKRCGSITRSRNVLRNHPDRDLRHRSHTGREVRMDGVGSVARFPTSRPTTLPPTPGYGAGGGLKRRSGAQQVLLAGRQPPPQQSVLQMVAVCQARSDAWGGAYYRKKIAEGKSRKEALGCLQRGISDAVFRSLITDLQEPSCSIA